MDNDNTDFTRQLDRLMNISSGDLVDVGDEQSRELELKKKEYTKDYEYVRKKLKNLLDESEDILEHMKEVALETSEPSVLNSVNNLISTMGKLSNSVMDNAKKRAEIDKIVSDMSLNTINQVVNRNTQNNQTINHNTVVVSDIHEIIDMMGADKEEDDVD